MTVHQELTIRQVATADAAWAPAIRGRRAMLWIAGQGMTAPAGRPNDKDETLRRLLQHPWGAAFIEAAVSAPELLREQELTAGDLPLRIYTEFPPSPPPPNRVPVYVLPGASAGSATTPREMLNRLQMLQRGVPDSELFVVGASSAADLQGVAQALGLSDAFRRCVIVSPQLEGPIDLPGAESVTHWAATIDGFLAFLSEADALSADAASYLVRVEGPDGPSTINLYDCVDHSAPITSAFELVPLGSVLDEKPPTLEDLQAFFADPSGSWRPYAAGVPHIRHDAYRRQLNDLLARLRRDGASATVTAWLSAEDGSGASTTLRQIAFELAQAGYPVLVGRPHAERFDFHQLAAFLTRTGERFAAADVPPSEAPWVIAFDSQHTELQWDFVTGLAAGLRKLQRPALVLAVRQDDGRSDDARREALGTNRRLHPALRSLLTPDQAVSLGTHLNRFLPVYYHRSPRDWSRFLDDTLRSTAEGPRSLFWVALRFWLLRVPGTEESLRAWLAKRVANLLHPDPALYATVLETAALSKYRLSMPRELVPPAVVPPLRRVITDPTNAVGLTVVHGQHVTSFSISHPLLADELLRLGAGDDAALSAVGKATCVSSFDLELHLFERILSRPEIGTSDGIELVEALVTSALRVDPREAPRNYGERQRIVAMLETVPDIVWDSSQIFNHHLAKARRHLAVDPPGSEWDPTDVRDQLELAENHLLDALENIIPSDDQQRESPLNLRVSLALTYDARAKHERRVGNASDAEKYRRLAENAYRAAQRTDADNSYVLENFARFKLDQANRFASGEDRIRLIVDAISLLEWERRVDETRRREEPILFELATAYEALERNNGTSLLRELAANGSEAAIVALAQLALREMPLDGSAEDPPGSQAGDGEAHAGLAAMPPDNDGADSLTDALAEAEEWLRRVPSDHATARSIFMLYRVVSRRRAFAFAERLDLLKQLDGDPDFAWPLQSRLEFGVLLFQVGQGTDRRRGQDIFRQLRDDLADRSASLRVPEEVKYLADPRTGFRTRLRTSITVRKTNDAGRNYFGIPYGWGSVEIPFRAHDFGPNLRPSMERDCFIRFTNFGPQAVPTTTD